MCVGESICDQISRFQEKKMFTNVYAKKMCYFKYWEYCFQAEKRMEIVKLIYRYSDQVYTKHETLFSISLESEQKQGRK